MTSKELYELGDKCIQIQASVQEDMPGLSEIMVKGAIVFYNLARVYEEEEKADTDSLKNLLYTLFGGKDNDI